MDALLKTLEDNANLSYKQLSALCGKEEGDIKARIEEYEKSGVILGYKTMIDWDKTDREYVSALIEVKITPQRDRGFDRVAKRVSAFDEVKSGYLASGGFDLCLIVEGKTMRDVAFFVSAKLAPIDGVSSTATHFIMKKYKDQGVSAREAEDDSGRKSCL